MLNRRKVPQLRAHQEDFWPDTWYDPVHTEDFVVIEEYAGEGYQHVVTSDMVIDRLSLLPQQFVQRLDIVKLSEMTRKRKHINIYGLQWGTAIYLYPLRNDLSHTVQRPPVPEAVIHTKMYGGVWTKREPQQWTLTFSLRNARDFFLNSILIHELGHLVDQHNASTSDREAFADHFAIKYGYNSAPRKKRKVKRRHHSV